MSIFGLWGSQKVEQSSGWAWDIACALCDITEGLAGLHGLREHLLHALILNILVFRWVFFQLVLRFKIHPPWIL